MPAFSYVALDTEGKSQKGVLEADSARHVRQLLREKRLNPLEVHSVSQTKSKSSNDKNVRRPQRKRVKVAELALITRQLATLLAAGLPVEEVLHTVAEQAGKPHIQAVLMGVRGKVLEGHTIADGMADFPKAFPKLYRATVAAGEQSGHLDMVLERLADYTEKQHFMRQKIQQALVYPTLMTIVSIAIVIFLLIYIVPKIITVFSQSGQALPAVTSALLAVSAAVQSYGFYALILIILLAFGFRQLLKKENVREKFQRILLKIPVVSTAYLAVNAARFSRTFGILFAATVPVLEAMRVAADLVTLIPMYKAIDQSIAKVREGSSIHRALQQTGYFVPMTIHLIAGGEASGQLENMLARAAENQDRHVTMLIESGLTLFEPMMIIVMGAIVLFIVLAIMLPIFQLDAIAGQL